MSMNSKKLKVACALLMLSPLKVLAAENLVVVGFGGAAQKIQNTTIFEPFAKKAGVTVVQTEYNGEMAKIKVMAETGHADWDVVQVEAPDLERGCAEGLFEKLEWPTLAGGQQLIEGAQQDCGSAALVWGMPLVYATDKVKSAPSSWADFWDTDKYPGKRGLRKGAMYTLEYALLADGVPAADIYKVLNTPAGVDRAFAKLDKLKPYIQWWEAGSQPMQWLASGDVVMTTTFSGRGAVAAGEGLKVAPIWKGSLYSMDYWTIVKGSQHKEAANKFIAYANEQAPQQAFSQAIAYGVTNTALSDKLDPSKAPWIPTSPQNMAVAVPLNIEFWVDHGEELEERLNAWLAR
jgi:putative spermidine/putrescine transport system substrate-binding protein